MMLRALVGNPLADDFPDVLAAETAKVAKQRSDSIGSDPVVIIEITGEVEATIPANARELQDFIVCFDAYDKKAIRAHLASQVSAVLTAFRIGTGNPIEFRQVSDGSYLSTPDGRVVHSASVEAGAPSLYVSHRLSEEQRQRIQADVLLTLRAGSLERVLRLHAQSLSKATDNFLAFAAGVSSIESAAYALAAAASHATVCGIAFTSKEQRAWPSKRPQILQFMNVLILLIEAV